MVAEAILPSSPLFSYSPGMGGSSILAAAALSAVAQLLGDKLDKDQLVHCVSQVEQGKGMKGGDSLHKRNNKDNDKQKQLLQCRIRRSNSWLLLSFQIAR